MRRAASGRLPEEGSRGGASLQEIAESLGCCRERVRQIERDALKKFRLGMDLWDLVGEARALFILEMLRSKSVYSYRAAVKRVTPMSRGQEVIHV